MKQFIFEGNSDDTFGEYGQTGDDYDNCASGEPITFTLSTPDGAGIIVMGQYNGCWRIGVEAMDEDKTIDWPISMKPNHDGYRNQLIVDAPDEVELVCLTRKENTED